MADFYASYPFEGAVSGSGTVTSVGLADGSSTPIYNISGSPVTTSGTLTFSLKTETANTIFSGPTTGAAAQPTFRSLVAADLPTGNLTDAGTDGIVVTGGTGAVVGSGTSIAQHVADTTHNGYLSSIDWNTFNNKGSGSVTSVAMTVPTFLSVSGSPVTTTGTLAVSYSGTALPVANGGTGQTTLGNLTDIGTDGIVVTGGTGAVITNVSLAQHVADATHNGYLSSTDWNTFNGKQAAGNYITALTGDVTATGPGSVAATVAAIQGTTVSGTTGTTNVVFSTAPTIAGGSISALTTFSLRDTSAAFNVLLAATSSTPLSSGVTLTLDMVNNSRTLKFGGNFTIASNVVIGNSGNPVTFTTVGSTNVTLPVSGTLMANPMTTAGDVIYGGASGVPTRLAAGTTSQIFIGGTTPSWGNVPAAALPIVTQSTAGAVASAGQLLGTNTNTAASAQNVGEYLVQSRLRSAATNLTSATPLNVTATPLTLTAGDWDIYGSISFEDEVGGTTPTRFQAAISQTSATLPATDTISVANSNGEFMVQSQFASFTLSGIETLNIPPHPVKLTGNTIFYLVAQSTFGAGTVGTFGSIWARRPR